MLMELGLKNEQHIWFQTGQGCGQVLRNASWAMNHYIRKTSDVGRG